MKNKSIHVIVGDRVEIFIPVCEVRFQGTVLEVVERFGTQGGTRMNPLLKVLTEAGEVSYYDVGHVTDVISRAKYVVQQPQNIYAESIIRTRKMLHAPKRGVLVGSLQSLIEYFLGRLTSRKINRYVDGLRAEQLFYKQRPGLIKVEQVGRLKMKILRVRAKPFQKWVERNVDQLLMTARAMDKLENAQHDAWIEEMHFLEQDFLEPNDCAERDNLDDADWDELFLDKFIEDDYDYYDHDWSSGRE